VHLSFIISSWASVISTRLLVWASSDLNAKPEPTGYLSIVYVEDGVGIDENVLSRYWTLSDQWPMDHRRCIESMLKVVQIGRSNDILIVGRTVDRKTLGSFENGRLFAPQVNSRARSMWYPEDLMEGISVA